MPDVRLAADRVILPPRLVRALLMIGLQAPAGQQVMTGYVLARDDVPWLQGGTYRIGEAAATVERVEVPTGQPAEDGVAPG